MPDLALGQPAATKQLTMPPGEEYTTDETLKHMILGGFRELTKNCTDGSGVVHLDELKGYLAGVVAAGLEIQEEISSYVVVPLYPKD